MKLAQNAVPTIFGQVTPPMTGFGGDPTEGLGKLISVGIQYIMIFALILLLIYMLWGAFDWLVSGGEKEKLVKAQNKITNAVIGMILIVASFSIFALVTGTILGNKVGIGIGPGGFVIDLPRIK